MPNENYILLERTELNASAASVTFANIPQSGYTDLKIVASARSTANGGQNMNLTFNSTTSGYSDRILSGNGSSAASFSSGNTSRGGSCVMPGADFTANTFGNGEVYIPNYLGSNAKSFSSDSVSENNATLSYNQMQATLWNNTAAINTILIDLSGGSFAAGSTFSLYGIAALGTTPVIAPKAIGGNIIDFDGTNWIHIFTSSGTFTPLQGLTCDYLVVAGGGGSGGEAGAGGGGGGYRTSVGTQGGGISAGSPLSLAVQSYAVTVGAGGAGGTSTGGSGGGIGANGTDSIFSTITALGGGGGSGYAASGVSLNGNAGGSGGGGGSGGTGATGLGGAASAPTQGYAGGTGLYQSPYKRASGGGGGAGSVGGNAQSNATFQGSGGNGGAGITSSISGSSVGRAGGGGGAGELVQGTGTDGGGTNSTGTVNTGGGGSDNYTFNGGNAGGSGVVIIRYPA